MSSTHSELDDVLPLFIYDFWDVPRLGICKHKNSYLFFRLVSDPYEEEHLRYGVYRLHEPQTSHFLNEWRQFERIVGTHWSFSETVPYLRIGGKAGVTPDWESFYKKPKAYDLKEELEKSVAELVGFFTWGSTR